MDKNLLETVLEVNLNRMTSDEKLTLLVQIVSAMYIGSKADSKNSTSKSWRKYLLYHILPPIITGLVIWLLLQGIPLLQSIN